tara:strand:+ start:2042 stop:3112 length:1071 start_codon:yes stop_codon:yes gene_type:complete
MPQNSNQFQLVMAKQLLLVLAGLFIFVPLAAAQEINKEDFVKNRLKQSSQRDFISLSVENDNLGGGTDQFYTSGVRLTYFNAGTDAPEILGFLDSHNPYFNINETTSTFFTLGHNIYTPQNIQIAELQEDDRPWAGFLYGSVGLASVENNHVDTVELTLGVVGPEALGKPIQKFVHKHIANATDPKGWDNQLNFEPGIILSWQRRWPVAYRINTGDFRLAAEPNINVSLGNVYTYAGAGVMLSFGPRYGVLQDTPPRVRPAMPGSGYFETPEKGWGWYIFAGADGRAVARNIFLDGNTFSNSHSVDKKTFVGDLTGGIAFTFSDYRLAYSLNYRSDEFDRQNDSSIFGSLTLSARF